MSDGHFEREMVGIIGRLETLESRHGRAGLIVPFAVEERQRGREIATLQETVARLVSIVESQQGQIEQAMELLGELGAG